MSLTPMTRARVGPWASCRDACVLASLPALVWAAAVGFGSVVLVCVRVCVFGCREQSWSESGQAVMGFVCGGCLQAWCFVGGFRVVCAGQFIVWLQCARVYFGVIWVGSPSVYWLAWSHAAVPACSLLPFSRMTAQGQKEIPQ